MCVCNLLSEDLNGMPFSISTLFEKRLVFSLFDFLFNQKKKTRECKESECNKKRKKKLVIFSFIVKNIKEIKYQVKNMKY